MKALVLEKYNKFIYKEMPVPEIWKVQIVNIYVNYPNLKPYLGKISNIK